jgi:hypothetical protein
VSRNEIGRTCPHVPGVSSSRALGQSASHHPLPGTSFPANGQANVYAFYVSFWVISIAPLREQRTGACHLDGVAPGQVVHADKPFLAGKNLYRRLHGSTVSL